MLILISLAAFAATLLGGLFAVRFKDRLHLILGFSAGAVIGVAFFDLLPEAFLLASNEFQLSTITAVVAGAFLAYMVLDRAIFFHGHGDEKCESPEHAHLRQKGILGAGSLSFHSFLDGVAIGLAFKVSATVGSVVTLAILAHDFSDGINTVNLILKNEGEKNRALKWLTFDAIAPVLGILSTFFFTVPEGILGIILACFAGFFLYIGASDLLPESHHNHPTKWTTFMTVIGAGFLFLVIRLAGI